MEQIKLHLLLADDDIDDCDFFQDAIDEISEPLNLTILNNGVELMEFLLTNDTIHPNLIFLDLNMPKKSGMEWNASQKLKLQISWRTFLLLSTLRRSIKRW